MCWSVVAVGDGYVRRKPLPRSNQACCVGRLEQVLVHRDGLLPKPRGGHLHVPCKSVCDWDQDGIKQSMLMLFKSGSRDRELRATKINDQVAVSQMKEI